jgi:hypothetical protein
MSFSLDLSKFVEKAKGNTHQVVQKTAINLISAVIDRSPVGNPELWAENKTAAEYNLEVVRYNQSLRDNPENLTKGGRLRRGLKVNDSMDIKAPDGYVGGRFRGNWQVTFDVKATGTLERIDPQGDDTKAAARGVVLGFTSDVGTIWAVNNMIYGPRLEFEGWSSQAPSGMVRISVAEFQSFLNAAARELPQ